MWSSLGKLRGAWCRMLRIIRAVRTPICKSRTGAFKDTPAEELLCAAIRGLMEKTGVDPKRVEDVVAGNVLAMGSGATLVRIASIAAG